MCHTSPDYSNDEFRALIAARKHFAEEDLDQFVHWRIACSWGEVYVTISNSPGPGAEPRMFDLVGPEMPLQGEPGGPAAAGRCRFQARGRGADNRDQALPSAAR